MGKLFDFQGFNFFSAIEFNLFSNGYIIFSVFGIILYFVFTFKEFQTKRIKSPYSYMIIITISFIAGIFSARLVNIIKDIIIYGIDFEKIVTGGIAYIGSLYGFFFTFILLLKLRNLKVFPILDIATVFIPLGHAFGRIGCFYAGCCFGKPTSLAIGVKYPYHSIPYNYQLKHNLISEDAVSTLSIFPVQLFEASFELIIFFMILHIYKKWKLNGMIVISYLVLYSVMRFFLEFFRGDDHLRGVLGWFSTSQYLCILLILICIYVQCAF